MGKKYLGGTQAHKRKATEELPVRQKKTDGLNDMTQPPQHNTTLRHLISAYGEKQS